MEVYKIKNLAMSLVLLLICSFHLSLAAVNCGDGVICSHKESGDEDYSYRFSQHTQGTAAVDVALVVSMAEGELDQVLWLQAIVPWMDARLKHLGIGAETAQNRFCLIQFGNDSYLNTKFLTSVEGVFFSEEDFLQARRMLVRAGRHADGYQALDFALKRVPFRSEPHIAKVVIFVSNTERSALPTHTNITRETVDALLKESGVLFTSVLSINTSIASGDGPFEGAVITPVIGLSGRNRGVVPDENYNYRTTSGYPIINSTEGGIIHDYVNLTLDAGGSVWSLGPLSQINVTVVQSFIGAVISEFGLSLLQSEQVCERCQCPEEEEGGVELEEECEESEMICEVAADQKVCACLIEHSADECAQLINPSPVSVQIRSTSTLRGPRQTPITLEVSGSVSLSPGGDVDVDFTSNKNRATYNCILLDNSTQTPEVFSCSSPFQMKAVDEGKHTVLIIAKRKGFFGTRRFDFEVEGDHGESRLEVALQEQFQLQDGFLLVDILVSGERYQSEGQTCLLCSISGGDLAPCTSPYRVHQDSIDAETGALLVVVAVESKDSVAMATTHLDRPVVTSTGPVRINILGVEPPDALGRIVIHFRTSRTDVDCLCRTNISHAACSSLFQADPQQLGSGTHNLSIVCMDYDGYSATKNLKVILPRPPPLVEGPLNCNLSLVGPTQQSVVLATFTCDRRVMATCQVSGRPAVSCNVPVGMHEIDVSDFSSGQHLFILSVEDGYGKSLMKIHQFTIGTAHRKCCPLINTALSSLTMTNVQSPYALLDLRVLVGNCTESEGFSYNINWGDSTSEMGLSHRLSNVAVSKSYSSAVPAGTAVEVTYCNNPSLQSNKCCDHATFLHN